MLRRLGLRTVVSLGCLGLLSGCAPLERELIFPGAATHGRADAIVPPSPDYELLQLTLPDGTRIAAQFGAASSRDGETTASAPRPTVIFFYGNGSCLAYSADPFRAFRKLGCNILIPEYPGYGMSNGVPSEQALYATADAAYEYLLTRGDVDRTRIVAVGWSLGAAVAIELAHRRPVSHLVTISAFTSLPAIAHVTAPWLPTSLLLRSRFDNAAKLPSVACPILLIHGRQDTIVPFAMSDALVRLKTREPLRRYEIPDAAHNDIFTKGGPELWAEIGRFLFGSPRDTR